MIKTKENLSKGQRAWNLILKVTAQARWYRFLRNHILWRKVITFYLLLIPTLAILILGLFSEERVTYSPNQLNNAKPYTNDTGSITLTNLEYSKSNDIMLLAFETTDFTTNIKKGINADNLNWTLYASNKEKGAETVLEIIPLTKNKIYAVIRNVSSDYGLMVLRIQNTTAPVASVDVEIEEYNDTAIVSEDFYTKKKTPDPTDFVDFYITPQNTLFKSTYIDNLTRENFALVLFNQELKFQKGQLKKLEQSVETLEQSLLEDEQTIKQLEREAKYLIGTQLERKVSDIETVRDGQETKNRKIGTARSNIETVKALIVNLSNNITKVEAGTFEFKSPIKSIEGSL